MLKSNVSQNDKHSYTWTYDMPYQYAWVEAYTQSKELEPMEAFEQIHDELDEICKIRIWESPSSRSSFDRLPEVLVSTLHASCPYCEEGAYQVLKSSNWAFVQEWTEEYLHASATKVDDVGRFFYNEKCSAHRINHDHFEPLHEALADQSEDRLKSTKGISENSVIRADQRLSNSYNIDYSEICRVDPRQPTLSIDNIPFLDTKFGIENIFSGIYRCEHCHHFFAVFFRSEAFKRDTRDDYALINDTLDQLLAYTSAVERIDMLTSVHVEPEGITLKAPIMGISHELHFDTMRGDAQLDNICEIKSSYMLEPYFFDHPIIKPYLFGMPDFAKRILSELNSSESNNNNESCNADLICDNAKMNVAALIAANRFKGYPSSFYENLITSTDIEYICPLSSGLPREYEHIDRAYDMTGLPAKKSLRRSLFENPILLFRVLHTSGIPFRNVDILYRFLNSKRVNYYLDEFNFARGSCVGWRILANVKGEATLYNYIDTASRSEIRGLSAALGNGSWLQRPDFIKSIKHTPLRNMEEQIELFRWIHDHPHIDLNKPYEFHEEQKQIEDSFDGFSFVLPKNPQDLINAGKILHNCLADFAGKDPGKGEQVTILIYEHSLIVGAADVRFNHGRKGSRKRYINEAHTACNKKISSNKALLSAFKKWVEKKGLACNSWQIE